MNTSVMAESQVGAEMLQFEENLLHLQLTGGRVIVLSALKIPWLRWLAKATPEQRAK